MAKNKEWIFAKADGTRVKIELIKKRRVTVNDGMEMWIDCMKAKESSFVEKVYDIQLGNGEVAKLYISNKSIMTYCGKNVETGEDYSPREIPDWAYIFVSLYVLTFLASCISSKLTIFESILTYITYTRGNNNFFNVFIVSKSRFVYRFYLH